MLWSDVTADPRWNQLDDVKKRAVADTFFKKNVATDPRFTQLEPTKRNAVYDTFLRSAFPPAPPKKTLGEKLTLTSSEDNLGGILGPPMRGLIQRPEEMATALWRTVATVLPSKEAYQKYGGDIDVDWLPNSENMIAAAEMVDNFTKSIVPQAHGKYAQAPETLTGYLNPVRAFNVLAEQAPTFVALGLKSLANKKALGLLYGAVGSGDAVQAIRDYEVETGDTVPTAYKRVMPIVVGGISGMLDVFGINEVFGEGATKAIKGKFARTLVQAVIEGSTEAMQEGAQILGEMGYTKPDAKQVVDRLALNLYGGLVMGGVIGGVNNALSPEAAKSHLDKTNVTKLDKGVEISGDATGKTIDAESNLPPKPYNEPDLLALGVDERNKIALNNQFVTTQILDLTNFEKGVTSETGINGTLHAVVTDIDLNIKQLPSDKGTGYLVTAKIGDRVKETLVPSYEDVAKWMSDLNDNYANDFIKEQKHKMPDGLTKQRPVEGQKEPRVTDPLNDPDFLRAKERIEKTGLVADIEVLDHVLGTLPEEEMLDELGRPILAQGQYIGRTAVGGPMDKKAGFMQISTPSGLYTMAHEIYHAYKEAVLQYNPTVVRTEGEFFREAVADAKKNHKRKPRNAEEATAEIIGDYFTGRVMNPSLETKIGDYVANMVSSLTDKVSKETIARTVVNRLMTRDPLQLINARVDPKFETPKGKLVRMGLENAKELEAERVARTHEKILDMMHRTLFDRTADFKATLHRINTPETKKLEMLYDLSASADNAGITFAKKQLNDVYGGLTAQEADYVNEIVMMRGELSKALADKKYILPSGWTRQGIKEELEAYRLSEPERFAEANRRASLYFDTTRALLDILDKAGLYSDATLAKLSKNVEYYTSDHLSKDAPVDPLMESKYGGLSPRSLKGRELLETYIARVFRLQARNDINLLLHEIVKANPDMGLGSLTKRVGFDTKVVGFVRGEPMTTYLPRKLADQFFGGDMVMDKAVLRWINTVGAGTKYVKLFATGINPLFHILYNPPMDWARIQFFTNTYSKFLPKGLMQMASDLVSVAPEVWKRKGELYDYYVRSGAKQQLLVNMGQLKNIRSAKLARLQEVLGYLGEFSEDWSRIAQMKREIRNGKSMLEAAYISRNSLDYYQGGAYAKALDTAIPYLNAGLQGARITIRYMKQNPGLFALRFGQLAMGSMALAAANMSFDEYEEVSEYDKMNNFIIMTPFLYKEKDGSTGRYYFKIRKEQALRPLLYLTEQFLRLGMGKPVNPDATSRIASSTLSALNIDPGNVPATLRSVIAMASNYDLWRGEQVWKGARGKLKDEYDENTPHIFRMLGAFTGLSPERLKVAGSSLVSPTNPFINLTGFGLEQLLRTVGPEEREKTTNQILQDISLVKGLVGTTYKRNRIMSNVAVLREQEASKRLNQNREIDRLSQVYWDNPTPERKKALKDYLRSQPLEDRSRLVDRYELQGALASVPDRDWWLSARGDSPEIRAIRFYDRYEKASESEKKELTRIAGKVPGFATPRFRTYLRKIRRGVVSSEKL